MTHLSITEAVPGDQRMTSMATHSMVATRC
jgi:hypothetical protein